MDRQRRQADRKQETDGQTETTDIDRHRQTDRQERETDNRGGQARQTNKQKRKADRRTQHWEMVGEKAGREGFARDELRPCTRLHESTQLILLFCFSHLSLCHLPPPLPITARHSVTGAPSNGGDCDAHIKGRPRHVHVPASPF